MESIPLTKRLTVLIGIFVFILVTGVGSMHIFGGTTGDLGRDIYRVIVLFGLEGDWAFDEPTNGYLKALVFIAPLLTVLGIIDLFTRRLVSRFLQAWTLFFIRHHVVIFGLTEESYLLIKSLRQGASAKGVAVIDPNPDPLLSLKCRKMSVPVIEGSVSSPATIARAQIDRADVAVSFVERMTDVISLVFSIDKIIREKGSNPVDVWLNFSDPEFGRRLGDYFKFANLSNCVHPRFFNLNEVAARRLVRQHPPDVYADALGHSRLHIAVYGFNSFAFEVAEEILLQTSSLFMEKPKISFLSKNPGKNKEILLSMSPQIEQVADIAFERLEVFSTGIAAKDYAKIPKDVTMHLICYEDPNLNTATGLALRPLLLTPPPGAEGQERRLNAPIFVRLMRTRGISQLLESHFIQTDSGEEKRGDIPDGIYAFGMMEDLLLVDQDNPLIPTAVDSSREKAAKFLHFSYVYDLKTLKEMFENVEVGSEDVERDWENLGPVFRESCRQEADHLWTKARLIRHRLNPKGKGEVFPGTLNQSEIKRLAVAEHSRWLTERRLAGWVYNKKRVNEAKRHNLLRPWNELSEAETRIDLNLAERISAAAEHAGLELKREILVGVVGHRFAPGRPFDIPHVRKSLAETFDNIAKKHPGCSLKLLTHLADGADTIAAEVALEKGIPFVAPLPLPFETYKRDFEDAGPRALEDFLDMISKAEFYFELPQKFGTLVDTATFTKSGKMAKARNDQYALGGAYIVERVDEFIAVWDGKPARGTGGTGDAVEWRKAGKVPEKYQTRPLIPLPGKMSAPVIIKPVS